MRCIFLLSLSLLPPPDCFHGVDVDNYTFTVLINDRKCGWKRINLSNHLRNVRGSKFLTCRSVIIVYAHVSYLCMLGIRARRLSSAALLRLYCLPMLPVTCSKEMGDLVVIQEL